MVRLGVVGGARAGVLWVACLGVLGVGCSCDAEKPMTTTDAGLDATDDAEVFSVDPSQQCVPGDVCGILDGSACGDEMQCRLFPQEGQDLTVACREQGEGALNSDCTMDFDCGPGLVCYNDRCLQYCCHSRGDANSHMVCPEDAFCVLNYTSEEPDNTPLPYGACVPQTGCDLIAQDCAGEDVGCYLLTRGTEASGYCLETAASAGQKGAACSANNDCAAGLLCVGDGKCAPICDKNAEDVCDEGENCNDLETAPENIGVCVPS